MVEHKKSLFKQDLEGEAIAGKFLDLVYYNNFFESYRRTSNPREQFDGIDVVVHTDNNKIVNIDEKVQLTKLGNPTPSFAFEVAFLKDGELKKGWLFKDNSTEYYLLGYFNKMNGSPKRLTDMRQIKEFELVVVSKKKIVDFLKSKGYTAEYLRSEAMKLKEIVDGNQKLPEGYSVGETGYRKTLEKGINVFYTTYLAERPLNVVIRREILDKLAKSIVRVTTGNGGKIEIIK